MSTTSRKVKVHWSQEEKTMLCREAAELIHSRTQSSRLAALNQAQLGLPEARRRTILTLGDSVAWYTEGLQLELKALDAEERARIAAEAMAPPDLSSLRLDALYPLVRQRLVTELAGFLTDVLSAVQWPEALSKEAAAAAVGSALLGRVAATAAAPATPTVSPKRCSVLIVGLRGGQMEEIRKAEGNRLDLRFFGSDESHEKLRFMSEQVDFVLAMTDFISHSHEAVLLKRKSHRYVRVAGGMTRLKTALRELQLEKTSTPMS